MNNRGIVVSERCEDQEWLEDCFVSADTDGWLSACEDTLRRPDRQELVDQNWERFKNRPFAHRLRQVLDAEHANDDSAITRAESIS